VQRRAEGGAVVARGGLHVDLVEGPRTQQLPVRGAVQGYPARQREAPLSRLGREMAAQVQHGPVEAGLQGGCHVAVHIGDLVVGTPRRHQVLGEMRARREVVLALAAVAVRAQQRNPDAAVRFQLDGVLEEVTEPLGVAVGGEPHDLVFVGVEVEAQVQRDERVQHADRVVRGDLGDPVEVSATRVVHGHALHLSHPIDHYHQALVPPRCVVRASGVREVVTDVMDPLRGEARKVARHEREQRVPGIHLAVQVAGDGIDRVHAAVGRVVEPMGQLVDVLDPEPGLSQAVRDRALGEVAGMLVPADPLFRHRRDDGPVHDQGRGRVVPL